MREHGASEHTKNDHAAQFIAALQERTVELETGSRASDAVRVDLAKQLVAKEQKVGMWQPILAESKKQLEKATLGLKSMSIRVGLRDNSSATVSGHVTEKNCPIITITLAPPASTVTNSDDAEDDYETDTTTSGTATPTCAVSGPFMTTDVAPIAPADVHTLERFVLVLLLVLESSE